MFKGGRYDCLSSSSFYSYSCSIDGKKGLRDYEGGKDRELVEEKQRNGWNFFFPLS